MNWNTRKIIEVLLLVFALVSFIIMLASGYINLQGLLSIILFLVLVIVPIFLSFRSRNKRLADPDYQEYEKSRKASSSADKKPAGQIDQILDKNNESAKNQIHRMPRRSSPDRIYRKFGENYDRALNINNHTLLIDEDQKEFIVAENNLLHRYDYDKLKDFKYYEDGGETIELFYSKDQIRPGIVQEESEKQIQDDIVGDIGISIYIEDDKEEIVDFKISIARNNRKGNFFKILMDQSDEILMSLKSIKDNQ